MKFPTRCIMDVAGFFMLYFRYMRRLMTVLCLLHAGILSAQTDAPNKTDKEGRRKGEWVICMDADTYFLDSCDANTASYYTVKFSKAVCWVNPVIYLLDRELKLTHEFIADHLAGYEDKQEYARALLAYNLGVTTRVLTNNFYQSSTIKNRIIILQKTTSISSTWLRLAMVLPLFLGFSFMNGAQAQSSEEVLTEVDKMPEFKGGTDGLIAYLGEEITYPEKAKKNGVEGKIFVQFTIDKKGRVKDATVIKGASAPLVEEALRVINNMPDYARLDPR
jgi:TonB family protein